MTLALPPARLQWTKDGIPYSSAFDDVYHAHDGGLAQVHAVFMAGNGLPDRWRHRDRFAICETGFGLGLSFLATWRAWRDDPQASRRLHFASCELHPFTADDLRALYTRLFAHDPALRTLGEALIAQWPIAIAGFHRLEFDGGRVVLTLLLGDALVWLPRLVGRFDAFYLDGFAPAKNPQLWQLPLFKQFARLAANGATLATYTVAGEVRRGLETAGFAVEKRPGFGRKRQMLAGAFRGQRREADCPAERHALVIGAGMAGAAISERLARRGWRITLLEAAHSPAQGASGNHAGAFRPVLSRDDNLQVRLLRTAFLYGLRRFAALPGLRWSVCGALQLARHADEAARLAELPDVLGLPSDFVRAVDRDTASALAGVPVAASGLWFPAAGWVKPTSLVTALIAAAGSALTPRYGCRVARLESKENGWHAFDDAGQQLATAPVLILANAADAARLVTGLRLGEDTRVVSGLAETAVAGLRTVVCGGGYLTPAHDGWAALGSSPDGADAHAENLALLGRLIDVEASIVSDGWQRRCTRPGTPDRLPIAGPVADASAFLPKHAGSLHLAPRQAGLYALTGLGARGLVWAPLLAELVASQINGEPLPIERELVHAVDPARFLPV